MPKREDEFWAKKSDDETSSKSKAWFGSEYFDKKTQKWKKPGYKTSSVIISILALTIVVAIVALVLYFFVFTKPAS